MNLGDAFTMAVPPKYDVPHLFFVISDPSAHHGNFIVVNITTDYIRAGKECVLGPGEHDWIKRECYVSLRDAMLIDAGRAADLQRLVGKLIIPQKPLTAEVLKKIVETARNSRSFEIALKRFL
jgi:hypothetical protein